MPPTSDATSSSSKDMPAPKACRFKHISWRDTGAQQGYVVQYQGRTVGGFYPKLKAACNALRKAMGLRKSAKLPLKPMKKVVSKSKSKVGYYGISYHKQKQGFVGNQVALGAVFPDAESAFQQLCSVLKRPASALPTAQKRLVLPQLLLTRVKTLISFGEPDWLPPDVLSSFEHCKISQSMCKSEPALELMSFGLKYGPWKLALFRSWQKLPKKQASKSTDSVEKRASTVMAVAEGAARIMAQSPASRAWPCHANRFRFREQGPTILLRNLGLVLHSFD